ncbi:hypothetical protein [Phosphitispora fastidiosa]|uniref:hypothetical protein n=1 Tax=Phosphitispora fastidiosa TaxID=2837202 RepID=UPI001E48D0EC|nr:hypothetical protein [Phosphitispora fastidiosa]MBU7007276.1 hypothetical protein [Phosphitispora fastidiosa]
MTNTKISTSPYPVAFHCREKFGRKYEEWDGYVKHIQNHGSHYEIHIESHRHL